MSCRDKYNIAPFAGENYNVWAFRLRSILKEHDVESAIDVENYVTQAESNKKNDAKAQALIIATVADSHLEYLKDKKSAYEMFKNLEGNFKEKSVRSKLFLRRTLGDMKYNEAEKLKDHIVSMERIFSLLKDAGTEVSEEEKVNYILLSMPKSYDGIITALETVEDLKLDFVKNRLLGEEEKKKKGQESFSSDRNRQCAFLCFTCGKPGHKKFQCWQNKYSHSANSPRSQMNSRGRGRSDARGRGRSDARGRGGAFVAETEVQVRNEGNAVAFISNCEGASDDESESEVLSWCVDSGCSNHLVNSRKLFSTYDVLKKPKKIFAAKNGVELEAIGRGNIEAICRYTNSQVTIKDVLHVPDVRKNLLSVSKMENNNLKVIFTNGKIEAYSENRLLLVGHKKGTLYHVDMYVKLNNSSLCNYSKVSEKNEKLVKLWHKRYGHLGYENLKLLSKNKLVHGLENLENFDINSKHCEPCILGKITRKPFNRKGYRAKQPLELVHTDVCGPISPVSWDGHSYFVTFIDDYTHFVIVYLLKHKSEVVSVFKNYYNTVTNHFGRKLLKLRSDNGGEYINHEMKRFCSDKGIVMQTTVPYSPELNGVAERMNRTLVDKARTILIDSNLSKNLWGEAIYFSAYVTNRSPTASLQVTPSEMWEMRKPNVQNLRVFGSTAYAHIPKQIRTKLEPKGKKLRMVGYSPSGYRLWDEDQQKVVIERNVLFFEEDFEKYVTVDAFKSSNDKDRENSLTKTELSEGPSSTLNEVEIISNDSSDIINEVEKGEVEEVATEHSRRKVIKPKYLDDYVTEFSEDGLLLAMLSESCDLPKTYGDIQYRDDRDLWYEAVNEELSSLIENNTWEVTEKPEQGNIIDCKWIFSKKKFNNSELMKARLVARGFQQEGDFSDIYSPVLKLHTLRILLSIAVQRDYVVHQMDVKGAFLYGNIEQTVYLKPPLGVQVDKNCVLKLNKSLYGLKNSPKCWYEKFYEVMVKYNFIRSVNDYCLYSKDNLYILVYVDDLLILSSDTTKINWVKDVLKSEFKMKDMGSQSLKYLGININKYEECLVIDQKDYLESVLSKFGMLESKPIGTPMDVNLTFNDNNFVIDYNLEHKCRSCIGSLMYAVVGTRPDLCASVSYLSRYQSKPSEKLWQCLKRVLRYVKGTIDYKLKFVKSNATEPLLCYADADFARDNDRKSTSGYLLKVYSNPVVWRSKKQSTVALSTTEAEFVALCDAASEACWARKLLIELNIDCKSTIIYEDNQSTIKAIHNTDQKRLKHMDVKYNFVKHKVQSGEIVIEYIPTHEQLADVFTKPLSKDSFQFLLRNIGVSM